MNEENYNLEQDDTIENNEKLMKKSPRIIISFFTLLMICFILFFVLQSNKFFIFNMNRSFDNVPNPMIAQMFSLFFVFIIIISIFSNVLLAINYQKRKLLSIEEQIESYEKYSKLYNLSDIFSVVPIFLVIVMIVNGFFFSFAQVDGDSMNPTFCNLDPVIIEYRNDYEKEDIVVFEYVENSSSTIYLIKRLIAGPGDNLLVDSTGVWVNGEHKEADIDSTLFYYDNITIPEGYYYVLGDNRDNSNDSRRIGLIEQTDMIGVVIIRLSRNTCEIS